MAFVKLKYQTLESDSSGDIAERRVSYQHGDYEDVTDLGEYQLYNEMIKEETSKERRHCS